MLRRRRPVLRAATMAGGAALAYHAGKNSGENQEMERQQGGQMQSAAPSQMQGASGPPASGLSSDAIDRLKELGKLRDQGILTDAEFDAQKTKLLGG
jgi:Short C-terminal domain